MFKRISVFAYGVASYAIFFVTFLYAVGFVGDIWVPKSIDAVPEVPLWLAMAVNSLLLGAFAIQLEERDLIDAHPEYAGYRKRVPMLVPRFKRTKSLGNPAGEAA
jgi:protein-S-isoprenylcysteine O-methyltransferase Ste14